MNGFSFFIYKELHIEKQLPLSGNSQWGCPTKRAEIIPFEPDTDNAGAGKKKKSIPLQ